MENFLRPLEARLDMCKTCCPLGCYQRAPSQSTKNIISNAWPCRKGQAPPSLSLSCSWHSPLHTRSLLSSERLRVQWQAEGNIKLQSHLSSSNVQFLIGIWGCAGVGWQEDASNESDGMWHRLRRLLDVQSYDSPAPGMGDFQP